MAGLADTFRQFYDGATDRVAEAMDRDAGWRYGNILPLRSRPSPDGDGRDLELALPNAVRELADAFTLPGRAVRGEPYTVRDVTEMALEVGALGAPVPRPRGSLGMFAGPNARTADLDALEQARALERSGVDPDEIWEQTGWGRGADQEWRFEIDDSASRTKTLEEDPPFAGRVADIVEHDELAAAYPEIGDAQFMAGLDRQSQGVGAVGSWNGRPGSRSNPGRLRLDLGQDDVHTVSLHELQHAVQNAEGFNPGDMPVFRYPSPAYDVYQQKLDELRQSHPPFARDGIPDVLNKQMRDQSVWEAYERSAGEVEARNTQARANFSPERRRRTPPWRTEDTPRDRQVIWQDD